MCVYNKIHVSVVKYNTSVSLLYSNKQHMRVYSKRQYTCISRVHRSTSVAMVKYNIHVSIEL